MPDTEIYDGLTDVLRSLFLRNDIVATPELTAKDIAGWDSFKQLEVVLATEQRFGVKFSTKEIDGLKSVGDLASLVSSKKA